MLGAKRPTFLKVFPGPRGRAGPQKPSLSFSLANHDSTVAQITPPNAARGHGGPNRFQNTLLSRLASPQNGPQKAKMNLADLSHRAIVIRSCEESDAFWGRPFAPSLSGELPPPRPPALLGGGGPPGIRRGRQPPRELPPEAQPSRGRKQIIYTGLVGRFSVLRGHGGPASPWGGSGSKSNASCPQNHQPRKPNQPRRPIPRGVHGHPTKGPYHVQF